VETANIDFIDVVGRQAKTDVHRFSLQRRFYQTFIVLYNSLHSTSDESRSQFSIRF